MYILQKLGLKWVDLDCYNIVISKEAILYTYKKKIKCDKQVIEIISWHKLVDDNDNTCNEKHQLYIYWESKAIIFDIFSIIIKR